LSSKKSNLILKLIGGLVLFSLLVGVMVSLGIIKVQIPQSSESLSRPIRNSDDALDALRTGNKRYQSGFLKSGGISGGDRDRLHYEQHPHAIVLSCSDSRVPPEIVFDQKLGEIFTIRTAGEALDYSEIASIEYAIEHLHSPLLVVMGHTQCGGIKAAMATSVEKIKSPYLAKMVQDIQPRIQYWKTHQHSVDYAEESFANAIGISKDLRLKSKIIDEAVTQGKLQIVAALYFVDSGLVVWQNDILPMNKMK
jgi:carbonic anhydrase